MVRLSLVNMYLHGFTAPHIGPVFDRIQRKAKENKCRVRVNVSGSKTD
jgi:hypothetical protein